MPGELIDTIDLGAAVLLLALTVVDVLVFVLGLIFIATLQSRSIPIGIGVVGWLATYALLTLFWLVGIVFGFGIHGTGPDLATRLVLQSPFFILSIAVIVIATRLAIRLRRSRDRLENRAP